MTIIRDVPIFARLLEFLYAMLLVIVVSSIIGLILAFPVMLLWNYIFTFYKINVFQAWALNVLTGILFGQKNASNK